MEASIFPPNLLYCQNSKVLGKDILSWVVFTKKSGDRQPEKYMLGQLWTPYSKSIGRGSVHKWK